MTASCLSFTPDFDEDNWWSSRYDGLGVLGADIPASSLFRQELASIDDAAEYRIEIISLPVSFDVSEDGVITHAAQDGRYLITAKIYCDGVLIGGERSIPVVVGIAPPSHSSGAILVIQPTIFAHATFNDRQSFRAGAMVRSPARIFVAYSLQQSQHLTASAMLQIKAGIVLKTRFYSAIQRLRHSGHYAWNNQSKRDQQEFVRQSPDSFTGLLYVVRDAVPVTTEPDQWRDTALFSQPDVNQRVTEYADPVVCYILERPRENMPFDIDMAGENLINEHEGYLTVCVDTDVPTGSALEFEDDLGSGETRRSWWYVHHSTSLGTTAAGAVYYLIPLRDFTGVRQ